MLKAKQKLISVFLALATLILSAFLAFSTLLDAPKTARAESVDSYVKITTAPTDWSGDYLIVYEDGNVAFNGGLTTLDAASNTIAVTITDNVITASEATNAAKFTIAAVDGGYTIKSASGYYIGQTSNANGLKSNGTTTYANTLSVNDDGTVNVVSGGAYLRYNATSGQTRFRYYKSSSYTNQKAICLYKFTKGTDSGEEPACTHEDTETSWAYDSETNEHYQQCQNCEKEIESTRAACSEFTYGEYVTENGVHTRTATCTVCGGKQTDSGDCEFNAEYVREGDNHTQTGTCSICNTSSSVTEACTLTYENVSKGNGTHNMKSTCSVCNQSVTIENVACTFEDSTEGATITHTCQYCKYSYTEETTTYTVTYSVPEGITAIDSVKIAEGSTIDLPTAETKEGFTFVGWTTEEYSQNTKMPETVYEADFEYTVTADVTLYALYTMSEGSGECKIVADASTLVSGDKIVIVASDSDYALSTTQNENNRGQASVTKDGDIITFGDDVQIITIEAGIVDGTFAFNVGNGYLYAASSSKNYLRTDTVKSENSSWKITIADKVATIVAKGSNTRNTLQYNKNNSIFSCYASGQQEVSIYKLDGNTFYMTSFTACEHSNTETETDEATCTETGSTTVKCTKCGATVSSTEIPALGHNYVDGFCSVCGEQDPDSIDYSGYYYFAAKRSEGNYFYFGNEWDTSKDRYVATDSTLTELPASITEVKMDFVFQVVKNNDGTYMIYEGNDGELFGGKDKSVTVVQNGNFYNIISDGVYFSFNNSTGDDYIRWYTSNQVRDIAFIPVELNANMDSASLTVKEDIAVNYYVTMSEEFENAVLQYTIGETSTEIYETTGDLQNDGRYKFPIELPPHYMTENINATLVCNGLVLDNIENYSIQTYVQNQLEKIENGELADDEGKLKQLLIDMLYYGAAAQNYKGYKTDNLASAIINEEIGTPSTATPTETAFNLENNSEISSYPAYFTGATVWFDDVNKLRVKINTTENVTMTINGKAVEITGTTIETVDILPTEFDKEFVFVLSYNGEVMQTLTYSVNSYAYAMKDDGTMGDLALALYRYGVSAANYNV